MLDSSINDLLNGLTNGSAASITSNFESVAIWSGVAGILAVVGSILVYFLYVKSKNNFKGFAKTLRDYLSFDTIHIESLIKLFYYGALIYVILTSINTIILLGGRGVVDFLIQLILGPIIIRLVFEILMMFVRIWKNTENLKKK